MRERAQMAGGWLTITSGPGMGTTLEYWLPIRPTRPAAIRDRLGVAS
jgi:signal transduction histidine kinase